MLQAQTVRPPEPTVQPSITTLPAQQTKSRIAILENSALVDRFQINDVQAAESFNRCLLAYTKRGNLKDAWRQFVSPEDTVGIHVNTAC